MAKDAQERLFDAISWVRKQDGGLVAFEPTKLTASLFHALTEAGDESAAFTAQELAGAVLHFLHDEYAGQSPTTDDIADTVTKVLRELGQGHVASRYDDYRCRRRRQRRRLTIHDPQSDPTLPAESIPDARWNKAWLIRTLIEEADVEPIQARQIATDVERSLLACGFERVRLGLVAELTDQHLEARGLTRALRRRRRLGIATEQLLRKFAQRLTPAEMQQWTSAAILRQFALKDVYSADVAGLADEGLLVLAEAGAPCQWSAAAIDLTSWTNIGPTFGYFCDRLDAELDQLLPRLAGPVAIVGLDAVLARFVNASCPPTEIGRQCFDALRPRLRLASQVLFGFGLRADRTEPESGLFAAAETSNENLARQLAWIVLKAAWVDRELASRTRGEIHLAASMDEKSIAAWVEPWLVDLRRGAPLSIAFDRRSPSLLEGIAAPGRPLTRVAQYVGIDLVRLHERLGKANDPESLFGRLELLCDSAARAGLQRREFLRSQQPATLAAESVITSVIVPIGLDEVVTAIMGRSLAEDAGALAFAQQLVDVMRQRLRKEARQYRYDCVIDHPPTSGGDWVGMRAAVGLTPQTSTGPKQALRSAGVLHDAADGGAVVLNASAFDRDAPLIDALTYALRQTQVRRCIFNTAPLVQPSLFNAE